MTRIGILAGEGELPLLVGKNLINKNFTVTFFVIKEFFNKNIYANYKTVVILKQRLRDALVYNITAEIDFRYNNFL